MAAISLSLARGEGGFKISDFTIGTLAPNADQIELRYNTTDGNGANVTREDIVLALAAFERAILSDALFVNAPPL